MWNMGTAVFMTKEEEGRRKLLLRIPPTLTQYFIQGACIYGEINLNRGFCLYLQKLMEGMKDRIREIIAT